MRKSANMTATAATGPAMRPAFTCPAFLLPPDGTSGNKELAVSLGGLTLHLFRNHDILGTYPELEHAKETNMISHILPDGVPEVEDVTLVAKVVGLPLFGTVVVASTLKVADISTVTKLGQ